MTDIDNIKTIEKTSTISMADVYPNDEMIFEDGIKNVIILKRFTKIRLETSFKKLKQKSFLQIFFGRAFIIISIIKLIRYIFNCCKSKDVEKSGDDEIIIIKHKDLLKKDMLKKDYSPVNIIETKDSHFETPIGDIDDIEKGEITDQDFNNICNHSSLISYRYANIFRFFDLLCKLADVTSLIFLPVATKIGIHSVGLIVILVVCVPLIMLQFMCEFGKLEDKYSNLYYKFKKLSSNKDDDRIDKYNDLVNKFRNNWVFSDFIRKVDVDFETQYKY
uniref:Uncharacterized protein n=1 Tax=viral metagenome TaxID=1070528 RepID=A0A6C0BCW8_9ZZZZ